MGFWGWDANYYFLKCLIPIPLIGYTVLKLWQYFKLKRLTEHRQLPYLSIGCGTGVSLFGKQSRSRKTAQWIIKGIIGHFSEIQPAPIVSTATEIWTNSRNCSEPDDRCLLLKLLHYNSVSRWHICQKPMKACKSLKMRAAAKKSNSGCFLWLYPALHII